MSHSIRAFVAVKVRSTPALRQLIERLSAMGRAVKPVSADHLHVTLKFLGDVDRESVPRIAEAMAECVKSRAAFRMNVVGLGAFPRVQRPSVVWAGLENAETLIETADDLEERMRRLRFPSERKPFHPHLTLARVRSRPPEELFQLLAAHGSTEFGTADVDALRLFQSDLQPDGPKYKVLTTAKFGTA